MSKLRDEYTRVFSEAETAQNEIDALLEKSDRTEADTAAVEAKRAENVKRFARLTEIKAALDERKKVAEFSLASGKADTGRDVPGTAATNAARDSETGANLDDDAAARAAVNQFVKTGQRDRRFAITTGTASGIMLPSRVLPPIIPTLDHVIVRALTRVGSPEPRMLTSTAETLNVPVIGAVAGSKITQGATNGAAGGQDQGTSDSFTLKVEPYGSGYQFISNTTLAAPGYDVVSSLLPALRYASILGQEADDIGALKADATLIAAATRTASTSAVTYSTLMTWVEALAARWQADQFILASPGLYSAILGLTSDAGNRLVQVVGGELQVNSKPVIKTDNLDAFGAINRVLGVTASARAVKVRDVEAARVNTAVAHTHRDQTGTELVIDHSFAYAKSGVVLLMTPAS